MGFRIGTGYSKTSHTGFTRQRGREYLDRKSTRLNSSHLGISYAVSCLKKKSQAYADQLRRRRPQKRVVRAGGTAEGSRMPCGSYDCLAPEGQQCSPASTPGAAPDPPCS